VNVCCRYGYCFILAVDKLRVVNTAASKPALRTYPRILSQELKQLDREADFSSSSIAEM
jgi:hypothetical protein